MKLLKVMRQRPMDKRPGEDLMKALKTERAKERRAKDLDPFKLWSGNMLPTLVSNIMSI